MKNIHLILQGKGGVGKSFIASVLSQYILSKEIKLKCFDLDPVNSTLAGFEDLKAERFELIDEHGEINSRRFDDLLEQIIGSEETVLIDSGASCFLPLSRYLIDNDVNQFLLSQERRLIIHSVIVGGQALMETVHGFDTLAEQADPNQQFVVWLNPFWGPIVRGGKSIVEMKAFSQNQEKILALVDLPSFQAATFGFDLTQVLKAKQTFDTARNNPKINIMARQRITIIQRRLFQAIAEVDWDE